MVSIFVPGAPGSLACQFPGRVSVYWLRGAACPDKPPKGTRVFARAKALAGSERTGEIKSGITRLRV